MTPTALITMILILGFVWGGLGLILATAVRREREKASARPDETGRQPR